MSLAGRFLIALGAVLAASCAVSSTASAKTVPRCTAVAAIAAGAADDTVRTALLCLINRARVRHGLAPVVASWRLGLAAQRHSEDMVVRGYFDHVSPDGDTLVTRARRVGYLRPGRSWELGEDIGWAHTPLTTARDMMTAWMNSPPHREVILDRAFRQLGVGIALGLPVDHATAGATFVLDFGVVR